MNPLNIAIPAAIALGLWFKSQAKKFSEGYEVKVHKVKFDGKRSANAAYLKLYFPIELNVFNPSDAGARIKGLKLNLFYDKKNIATTKATADFVIEPKKAKRLFVTTVVPTLQALGGIIDAVKKLRNGESFEVDVQGELEFTLGTVKFNKQLKVELPA